MSEVKTLYKKIKLLEDELSALKAAHATLIQTKLWDNEYHAERIKIAQEKYDNLAKRAWDNSHRSEIDRKALMSLQEKYDKRWRMLNEAQTVWVARDGAEVPQIPNFPTGQVTIFENKPQRWAHGTEEWQPVDGNVFFEIKPDLGMYLFPELKWEDEPLEIRLLTPEEMDGKK